MKRFTYILLTLVLVSCGTRHGQFKIEGRFLNLNQGEFYVYSPDGLIKGIDTIKVDGGHFTYQTACQEEGVLMLVFPNFSEQPIFAESGSSVNIKADASHLKELTVEGTQNNELMTTFRQQIVKSSPPETARLAETFIKDHKESSVSVYLLKRYFIQRTKPDFNKPAELASILALSQPKNGTLNRLKQDIDVLKKSMVNNSIAAFSATSVDGKKVSNWDIRGKYSVIYVWSTWNYDSQDVQRYIRTLKQKYGNRLGVIGISVDASQQECKSFLQHDEVDWPIICDEKLFESPILQKFGLRSVPANLVIDTNGKIIARNLTSNDLKERLDGLLK